MTPSPLEIALERIEECRRTHSTELDLSGLGLEEIPEAVFELTWLEKLDVSGDSENWTKANIREIPETILRLDSLTKFYFQLNQIDDISPIRGLLRLQLLDCRANQISELAPLCGLLQLHSLDCALNQIQDLSSLSGLLQLQSLDCGSNKISDLSPLNSLLKLQSIHCPTNQIDSLKPLGNLRLIQSLDCSFNQIGDLSPLSDLTRLQFLDCSLNQISDLSPLNNLSQLQSLNCSGNQVCDLSPLSNLLTLRSIDCHFNEISDLSPLSSLPALQLLYCRHTQVNDLSPLRSLTTLQTLGCSYNQISDLSPLSSLSQLQSLSCDGNKINNLIPLSSLSRLQSLSCENNEIGNLMPLRDLPRLRSLYCSYNQIRHLLPIQDFILSGQMEALCLYRNPVCGIPSALLGSNEHEACEENLRNYWLDLANGSEKQRQLKVQLVGNGRVGKTTLAYALERKRASSESFKSTHGIIIKEIQQALDSEEKPVTLQLWDFGGQEIYHATHRLFLSDDCLYLLLWAEETEEHPDETRHPVSYWLELIHDLAPNSQVIIVKNQIDRSDRLPTRPAELTEDMPGIKQIRQEVKISAMQYRGMPTLRGAIESVIEELKHKVCLELPTSWLQVQHELKQLDQNTIPFTHFKQLCIKAGIDHAEWFVGYLHKTGVLFYQEGAFQDQIILNQDWVIKAVYRIFDPDDQRSFIEDDLKGHFKGRHAKIVWSEVDEIERNIYLDFMRNCGICYEPNRKHDTPFADRIFIIPALLPESSTAKTVWGNTRADDWKLDIVYPFLHRSIIERIILRLGETYQGEPWRTGIFCNTEYGQVLLECTYRDKQQSTQGQLNFHLRGNQLAPLVYALRKLVSEISPHRRYQEFLQQGKTNRAALPEFKAAEENFSSRLDPIEPTKTLKLFISYSRVDRDHKLTLEKHLRLIKEALKHQVKLDIWSDHLMDAGEGVNDQILPELRSADLILLLVSPDFLDPERYSCRVELPIALERHEKEGIPVAPVIIRHTHWQARLGHLTVPTKENANPLEDWSSADKFWGSVQSGIHTKIEKLLKT
ncbi:leucine-rich repeat domain-containing protein [Thiothrix fructosivorans]|nr:leucine-rich repeat domain-containing protein [Thiothrix fructosivorans]